MAQEYFWVVGPIKIYLIGPTFKDKNCIGTGLVGNNKNTKGWIQNLGITKSRKSHRKKESKKTEQEGQTLMSFHCQIENFLFGTISQPR